MEYNYKKDFPLLAHSDIAYLDSAATAQRPQCVIDAERDFYCLHNANPLRGLYPLSVAATEVYENARNSVRAFIGAKSSEEIIFTRNTTESLNLVAYSYGLTNIKAGDEILAGKVADLGSLGGEVLADLGDLVAVNQDVDDTVKLDRRIDDVGILKKQGHYRHLQAADTG